jgi:hypothetical protein
VKTKEEESGDVEALILLLLEFGNSFFRVRDQVIPGYEEF